MWEMESKEPFSKNFILICYYIFCRIRQVTVLKRSADLKQQNQRESCPKNDSDRNFSLGIKLNLLKQCVLVTVAS